MCSEIPRLEAGVYTSSGHVWIIGAILKSGSKLDFALKAKLAKGPVPMDTNKSTTAVTGLKISAAHRGLYEKVNIIRGLWQTESKVTSLILTLSASLPRNVGRNCDYILRLCLSFWETLPPLLDLKKEVDLPRGLHGKEATKGGFKETTRKEMRPKVQQPPRKRMVPTSMWAWVQILHQSSLNETTALTRNLITAM